MHLYLLSEDHAGEWEMWIQSQYILMFQTIYQISELF